MASVCHIVSSDDVLLMQDTCDAILANAKKQGVEERQVVDVTDKFSWSDLQASNQSMSLFAEQKITDIRFDKLPKKEAQVALNALLDSADQDNQFLIRFPKLEKRQKSTKWFKSLSQKASFQELWPPKPHQFVNWISNRAGEHGVQLDQQAVMFLADRTEGNLLAADQSLQKLKLLYSDESVDIDKLIPVISDSAKYNVFLCLDEMLAGKGERSVKMLRKFEKEGVAPISIMVNLIREVEMCLKISLAVSQGQNAMQSLSDSYLWDSKKKQLVAASARLPLVLWQKLLVRCAFMDRLVKGRESGDIWQELASCIWLISGVRLWGRK